MAYNKQDSIAVGEAEGISNKQVGIKQNITSTVTNTDNSDPGYRSPIMDRILEYGDDSLSMFKNVQDKNIWHLQWDSPYKEEKLKLFGFRVVSKNIDGHLFKDSYFREDFGGRIISGNITQGGDPTMVLYIRPMQYELEDEKGYAELIKNRDKSSPEKAKGLAGTFNELNNTSGINITGGGAVITDNDGSRWGSLQS